MNIDKEEITRRAFKRYKSGESYEDSVWYLSELSAKINKNIIDGYDIKPLETDNIIVLLRDDVNGEVKSPTEEEVKEVAEVIYSEAPPKSELHWFIEEKALLLAEIRKIIYNTKSSS